MIKVQPKNYANDGCHFSFVCETQEEMDYLKENQEAILDKFVQGNFHNIGHLNIQTYKDYQAFGRLTLQEILEDCEGHACRDFGQLERESAGILLHEATKDMTYTPLTCANLERLANDMFLYSHREEPATKVCEYLDSLGCTVAMDKHAGVNGTYISVYYKETRFGRMSMEGIYLYLLKPTPTMEFFKFSPTLLDDCKFKTIVESFIASIAKGQEACV